jgi:hypothetical protein
MTLSSTIAAVLLNVSLRSLPGHESKNTITHGCTESSLTPFGLCICIAEKWLQSQTGMTMSFSAIIPCTADFSGYQIAVEKRSHKQQYNSSYQTNYSPISVGLRMYK